MTRDDLHPPIRVKVIAVPDHYIGKETGSYQRWTEQVLGKIVMVQEYKQHSLDYGYHITNCPENDALEFFLTRNAYKRKGMGLNKKYFIPLRDNRDVKDALSKLKED